MNAIFSLFAGPLGVLMRWIYQLIPSYFVALLIFTVLTRLILFPLSIKNQKSQADRARLAPRLERIQKKYAQDRQKAMMKQQELYEKEGVKMTGGCLPMLVQMLVLFSVIAVIYKPVTYIQNVDSKYIDTCIEVAVDNMDAKTDKDKISQMKNKQSYYRELYLFDEIKDNREEMIDALVEKHEISLGKAADVVDGIDKIGDEFSIFGISLLEVPTEYGIKPNWLWIIVLASGLSAFFSGQLSMHYTKAAMSMEQQQAGGCNNAMMYMMPLMSLIFSFTVPAGVAVYWTFSNLLAMVQTVILNAMWNPAKIRAQAEAEYAERRRKRREDKERLKAARLAEQAAWQEEENKARARAKGDITQKKAAASTATPAELPQETVDHIPEDTVDDTVEEE
ncbi:MAG: YidC/Oxa1 family membrane protein insertase [Clostridia bacterium]|nr:YidC/Oxa1 family membrane protein insertase [Clostridia bacterium]